MIKKDASKSILVLLSIGAILVPAILGFANVDGRVKANATAIEMNRVQSLVDDENIRDTSATRFSYIVEKLTSIEDYLRK